MKIAYGSLDNVNGRGVRNVESGTTEVKIRLVAVVQISRDFEIVVDELGVDTLNRGASQIVCDGDLLMKGS